MGKFNDLTGLIFGKLLVIKYHHKDEKGQHYWLCKCGCGADRIVNGHDITRTRGTRSCGCIRDGKKHGFADTRIYNTYNNMIKRCFVPKDPAFPGYGGRGITVCEEWLDINVFNEWAISSGYNDTLTIERIDNDGNYCPENCRWASYKEQANNKRNNKLVTVNGVIKTLAQWADFSGLGYDLIKNRLRAGWSEERAVTTPPVYNHDLYQIKKKEDDLITFNGKTLSLVEWSVETGVPLRTLKSRLFNKKWSIERTLTEPMHYNMVREGSRCKAN